MEKLIYAYRIKDTKQVVYVGQTNDLDRRRKQHEIYDVINPHQKEYYYPLSRGIRKHGLEYYECVILERTNDLDIREKYWINYYDTYNHGYNQTEGGQLGKYNWYSEELIQEVVNLLKYTSLSFDEISQQTGLAISTLSEINTGHRRHSDLEKYPLRELTQGRKISQNELYEIKELLETSTLSMEAIAKQYNVCGSTIRSINSGKRNKQENWTYPLRKKNTWKY